MAEKATETKATEKATEKVNDSSTTEAFIERKLNILNAKGTAKAQRAMARIIANNQGGNN